MVKDRDAWHAVVHEVAESDMTEWLNNGCATYLQITENMAQQRVGKQAWPFCLAGQFGFRFQLHH